MKPELKEKMDEKVTKAKDWFKKMEGKRKNLAKFLEDKGNFDLNIGKDIPTSSKDIKEDKDYLKSLGFYGEEEEEEYDLPQL